MLYNIYFSPTGGTKKVADILAQGLGGAQGMIDLCDPAFKGADLEKEDVALIAIPAYAGRVPCTATDRLKKIKGNGAKAVLLCVYGNRAYDDTLAEMTDLARQAGVQAVAAVAALAEHSVVHQLAAGRPDGQDKAALEKMAAQINDKLERGDCTPVQVPGTVPDQPIGNAGGKAALITTEDCVHCGLCERKCPAQAIDKQTKKADKSICIGCMRCVSVCPVGAKKQEVVFESLGGVPISVLSSQRKENELFL